MIAQVEYLAGKVIKRSLPVITGRPGPEAPVLKRLLLPQGELAQILDSEEGIHYLATFELRVGGTRGNHYHKIKQEWIYVIQGKVVVIVQDTQTSARATVPLAAGDLLLIPTLIAHALQPIEPGQGIEFSTARFNAEDIFPLALT